MGYNETSCLQYWYLGCSINSPKRSQWNDDVATSFSAKLLRNKKWSFNVFLFSTFLAKIAKKRQKKLFHLILQFLYPSKFDIKFKFSNSKNLAFFQNVFCYDVICQLEVRAFFCKIIYRLLSYCYIFDTLRPNNL